MGKLGARIGLAMAFVAISPIITFSGVAGPSAVADELVEASSVEVSGTVRYTSIGSEPGQATVDEATGEWEFRLEDVSVSPPEAEEDYSYQNRQSDIRTTSETRYYRIDPATGDYVASDYLHTVVNGDPVRVVIAQPAVAYGDCVRVPFVCATPPRVVLADEIYNVDPTRAGSHQIDVDFVTINGGGPATGPGYDDGYLSWTYECHPDFFISVFGQLEFDDGLGNTLTADILGTILIDTGGGGAGVEVTGGTGSYEGATGVGLIVWESLPCDVPHIVQQGRLSIGVLPQPE